MSTGRLQRSSGLLAIEWWISSSRRCRERRSYARDPPRVRPRPPAAHLGVLLLTEPDAGDVSGMHTRLVIARELPHHVEALAGVAG